MRTTVLAYHAVGDCAPADDPHNLWVPTAVFAAQMHELARSRQVVPLSAVVDGEIPRGKPVVALTFDDAYRSVLTAALPILQDLGFPATVFTPTKHIGDRNRWDPPVGPTLDVLDEDELRHLERSGITIESHGHSHIDLSSADEDTAREDLAQSIDALASVIGRRPRMFAFPFRTGSIAAQRVAAELGFRAAFSIDLPHGGRYAWGRVSVAPSDGPLLSRAKTSGHYLRVRHNPAVARTYRWVRPILPSR